MKLVQAVVQGVDVGRTKDIIALVRNEMVRVGAAGGLTFAPTIEVTILKKIQVAGGVAIRVAAIKYLAGDDPGAAERTATIAMERVRTACDEVEVMEQICSPFAPRSAINGCSRSEQPTMAMTDHGVIGYYVPVAKVVGAWGEFKRAGREIPGIVANRSPFAPRTEFFKDRSRSDRPTIGSRAKDQDISGLDWIQVRSSEIALQRGIVVRSLRERNSSMTDRGANSLLWDEERRTMGVMNPPLSKSLQCFDPSEQYSICERRLPHWSQAGTVTFITWRTYDSIPAAVFQKWLTERNLWLHENGIDPQTKDWRIRLRRLDCRLQEEFQKKFSQRWNDELDSCHGQCVLRQPELSRIVAESLHFFDGERYELTDFVVMPNHVHILAAFLDDESLLRQCDSWKHYTAVQINRALGRKGHFWQDEGFDHLVRSPEQFNYLRGYIADNPLRAALRPGEFVHYSKSL